MNEDLGLIAGITAETCCISSNFMQTLLIQREGFEILQLLPLFSQSLAVTSYWSDLTGIFLARELEKYSLQ